MEQVTEKRSCMLCSSSEGHGAVCYPVWAWDGKFMGRWCDWCRELHCWDCGRLRSDCGGTCESPLMLSFGIDGEHKISA